MTTATDEIKSVRKIFHADGEWCAKCPHCRETVYLPSGPIRGEQFQHSNSGGCNGWFEVTHDAKADIP